MKIRYYLPASGVYRKSALRRRERLLPAGLPSHFDCDEGSEILRFRAIPVQLHWQIVAGLRSAGRYGPDTGGRLTIPVCEIVGATQVTHLKLLQPEPWQ